MQRLHRILVVDDEFAGFERIPLTTGRHESFLVERATTGAAGLAHFRASTFDLLVTELRLADMDGLDLVRAVLSESPDARVVVLARDASIPSAVEAIKAGAVDFAAKSSAPVELRAMIDRALLRPARAAGGARQTPDVSEDVPAGMVGGSPAMRDVLELVRSVAASEANILIIGETGTGKERIAKAVHEGSLRSACPLVTVNCAAVPLGLFENELFGHERGAFTGADRAKRGLIGAAAGGSLVLDEIGSMPLELQPKLLRVLQDRVYRPVGSLVPRHADFRLISSTNQPPHGLLGGGLFRQDLYYRIATVTISLPPLRERLEDLAQIADDFLRHFARRYERPATCFSAAAREAMARYAWPGNLRELRNVVERAVLLARGSSVELVGLPPALLAGRPDAASSS